VPLAPPEDAFKDALYQEQLLEWIGLALINSPRILEADNVDPYLCRYEFPDAYSEGNSPKSVHDIVHVQWRGLVAPNFASAILSEVYQPGQEWMAYSLSSFEGALHTSFVVGDRESLRWEYG
jgi:ribonuclease P/MRP protein subunit RPP40